MEAIEKILLESKYVEIKFDEKTGIYSSKYLPETGNLTDEEFKELMLEIHEIIEACKPTYIIDDNRERLYAYSPDIQNWVLQLFVTSWNKIGLKKYVQIVPEDIINQITSDQIEEQAVTDFSMQYKHKMVKDYKSAMDWIND